jgi:hypothetical protein
VSWTVGRLRGAPQLFKRMAVGGWRGTEAVRRVRASIGERVQ